MDIQFTVNHFFSFLKTFCLSMLMNFNKRDDDDDDEELILIFFFQQLLVKLKKQKQKTAGSSDVKLCTTFYHK